MGEPAWFRSGGACHGRRSQDTSWVRHGRYGTKRQTKLPSDGVMGMQDAVADFVSAPRGVGAGAVPFHGIWSY